MEETRKLRGLQVVIHARPSGDPVEEHTMVCLRSELESYGLEQLSLIQANEITVDDARMSIRVKAALADSRFDLSAAQFEEIMRIGYRSAGVLREQIKKAS